MIEEVIVLKQTVTKLEVEKIFDVVTPGYIPLENIMPLHRSGSGWRLDYAILNSYTSQIRRRSWCFSKAPVSCRAAYVHEELKESESRDRVVAAVSICSIKASGD